MSRSQWHQGCTFCTTAGQEIFSSCTYALILAPVALPIFICAEATYETAIIAVIKIKSCPLEVRG